MKAKVKVTIFLRNKRECGIRYALLWYLDLPYSFDFSHSHWLRKLSDWAYDWCNQRYQKCMVPVGRIFHEPEFTEYLPAASANHPSSAVVQTNLEATP